MEGMTYPGKIAVSTRTPNPRQETGPDRPRAGDEALRVLRVDTALDAVPTEMDVLLLEPELLPVRNAELLPHDVDPVIASVTGCSTWMRVFISRK
jgi:hypothetical protein